MRIFLHFLLPSIAVASLLGPCTYFPFGPTDRFGGAQGEYGRGEFMFPYLSSTGVNVVDPDVNNYHSTLSIGGSKVGIWGDPRVCCYTGPNEHPDVTAGNPKGNWSSHEIDFGPGTWFHPVVCCKGKGVEHFQAKNPWSTYEWLPPMDHSLTSIWALAGGAVTFGGSEDPTTGAYPKVLPRPRRCRNKPDPIVVQPERCGPYCFTWDCECWCDPNVFNKAHEDDGTYISMGCDSDGDMCECGKPGAMPTGTGHELDEAPGGVSVVDGDDGDLDGEDEDTDILVKQGSR